MNRIWFYDLSTLVGGYVIKHNQTKPNHFIILFLQFEEDEKFWKFSND